MKTLVSLVALLALVYLSAMALLFFFQRSLLFQAVPAPQDIERDEISFNNQGLRLHGWVLNKGRPRALIYFGGNSEVITQNITQFESLFKNHSVYLIHYRGYGKSEGKPSEAGLFSDAMAIYDQIKNQHSSISLMGRSLGSGVAVYLAAKREIEQLILLTPYNSIAAVAQGHYPLFPTQYLIRDRFESIIYAPDITAPVLIITAELDKVVPVKHAIELARHLDNATVSYEMINSAAHNDVTEFPRYEKILLDFIKQDDP